MNNIIFIYADAGALLRENPDEKELYGLLKQWEFGNEFNADVSLDYYSSSSFEFLSNRYNELLNNYSLLVLDSSWLQNVVNEFLYRNFTQMDFIKDYCIRLLNIRKDVTYICVYLEKDSAKQSVEDCREIKGQGWVNGITNAIMNVPFGVENDVRTDSAMFDFFGKRYDIEQFILSNVGIKVFRYHVKELGWDQVKHQLESELQPVFRGSVSRCLSYQNR